MAKVALKWCSDYSPRQPAEQVPPDIAREELYRFSTRRTPEGLFRSAWNQVEYALNQQVSQPPEARDIYLQHTQDLLGMIVHNPSVHQDVLLNSYILSSYIPLLRKRSHKDRITREDCESVYESVAAAMAYMKPLDIHEPPQWIMLEAAVLALSARTRQPELLLYPSSPREENSDHARLNHDSYFFQDMTKYPIQQKLVATDKDYDAWIQVLTLEPLVDKAFKRADLASDLSSYKINYLLSLIIAEAAQEELAEDEKRFLDILSSAVASYRKRNGSSGYKQSNRHAA